MSIEGYFEKFTEPHKKETFFSGLEIGTCLLCAFGVVGTESAVHFTPSPQDYITSKSLHSHTKIKDIFSLWVRLRLL